MTASSCALEILKDNTMSPIYIALCFINAKRHCIYRRGYSTCVLPQSILENEKVNSKSQTQSRKSHQRGLISLID